MSYDTVREQVFTRLGLYVDWWYKLNEMKGLLDASLNEAIEKFGLGETASAQDKAAYEACSVEIGHQKDQMESLRETAARLASDFFGLNAKVLIDSPHSTPEAILDHLIDAVGDAEDHVLANTIPLPDITDDLDNLVHGWVSGPSVSLSQMARNDRFAITCIDDSMCGQERWQLESARLGQYPNDVITSQDARWPEAGIASLTMPATGVWGLEGTKFDSISFPDARKGVNIGADGTAWLKFVEAPSLPVENDPLGQVSELAFSTLAFGSESDTDGKLYLSLVKDPASVEVLGGMLAEISDVVVTGANQAFLYVTVEKEAETLDPDPTYTITLYSDSSRNTEVASWQGDIPEGAFPADPIVLTGSSVAATLRLGAFNAATGTDDSIVLKLPAYFVRVYRSAGRSQSDLLSQGVCYEPNPGEAVELGALPGFSTAGTVTLKYIQDSNDIVVTAPFYTVDVYRADPATHGKEFVVARAGSTVNMLTSESEGLALSCYEVNGSGLTGISMTLNDSTVNRVYSLGTGYRYGDTFTITTTSDDQGRFQTFMRDNFAKTLPETASNPGISEEWAGASAE